MFRTKAVIFASALVVVVSSGSATAIVRRPHPPTWLQQTVFAIDPSNSDVAEWLGPGAGWGTIGGPAKTIYAGSAGVFMIDPASGDILKYNGTPFSWSDIGGPGANFVQSQGRLYGLAPDGSYVAEWSGIVGGGWTIIGGPAGKIQAGGYGLIETDASSPSRLLYYTGTPGSWTEITGTAGLEHAVGANAVYVSSQDGYAVWQWTADAGLNLIGPPNGDTVDDLQAGGAAFTVDDVNRDQMLEYGGTPGSWPAISGSGSNVFVQAVSYTNIYGGVAIADRPGVVEVYEYAGSGTTWTDIGGPYTQIVAGD